MFIFRGYNLPSTELVKFLYFSADNLESTTFLHKNLVWESAQSLIGKLPTRLVRRNNLTNPQRIGGPGQIVEIDEPKFGLKKYSRGR